MSRRLAVWTLALAAVSVWALALAGGPTSSNVAHALPPQIALTVSYSVLGGTGVGIQDNLTYVSGGVQQIVPLTGSPTVYMADAGTGWSVQSILNGSTPWERWITAQDVSGTIGAPLTVSFSYYHQYLVNFLFNVTNGGIGFTGPLVSYDQIGAPASAYAPVLAWADASSSYSYASQLPGSNSSERWVLPSGGGSGTVTQRATVVETYHHEYYVSSSFSIVNGGAPTPPSLTSTALGLPAAVDMTSFTQGVWFDAGANYTFTSPLVAPGQSANETWVGTVLVQTPNGHELSMGNKGIVFGPISITPVFYHQYFVKVKFDFVGGNPIGLTPPTFTYRYFGNSTSVGNGSAVWVDSGTQYTLPENICCTNLGVERWELFNSTSGTLSSPTTISSTYFHQYYTLFFYSIVGQQPPSPSGQPALTYVSGGNAQHLTLLLTPQSFWADANSTYSATSTVSSSGLTERWFSDAATGTIAGTAPKSFDVAYDQQYLVTIVGGGAPTEWVDAGNNVTLAVPGVYGRSDGTGYRAVSYQIDSGPTVSIAAPAAMLSIALSMNGPHTIEFQSVIQFQVSLDAGAAGGLGSITPPTAPGDDYWYDAGSSVQVVLTGAWGRADGVGQRLTSISVPGRSTIQVDGVGTVQAYSTPSLLSPVSITTTSLTQYEVVLNQAALAAFSSISPPSTFPNDTFWYDSGSPAVTVVLDGAHSRAAGTGVRTTSWELDSGPVTKVAQTGPITIVTRAMNAAQFLNATSVVQYQVTVDAAGSSALASMSSPSIPLDSGWYDASSPMGLTMNGIWGRGGGTGHRLAGYSLNGGPEEAVATTGLVEVLNLTAISSPEAVTTTVTTQYQVTLDSGASSSLSSMTPTPIPLDKYWYDSGESVAVSLNGVWGRTTATGNRLLSYSVDAGAPIAVLSSSPVQVLSVPAITGPQSITTKANVQFHVTSPVPWASITNPSISGDAAGWFDTGTKVNVVFDSVWNQTSTGSRESVSSYTINGAGKTNVARSGNGTFSIALSMTQAQSIALTSVTQYLLTVVGPPGMTATPPSQTGDSYFDSGSKVTLTVPRAWNWTSGPGARQALASYSIDGAAPISIPASNSSTSFATQAMTFSRPHTLDFRAVTQYRVEFQFMDGLGKSAIEPDLVQIGVGNSTMNVEGPSVWLVNGTSFTVVNVTWEGAGVGPEPPPSYLVKAAPLNVTLDTAVYQASFKAVDLFGLPVAGAQVSMTLANGTTLTGVTKADGTFSAGTIPVGTYTAKVTSLGTSARIMGDAASGRPTTVGRVPLSLVSLFAVVAAAAGAASTGFLFVRRRKRAKGPNGAAAPNPK